MNNNSYKVKIKYCRMNLSDFDTKLRKEVSQFILDGRTESSAFLVWYIKNFFRLEETEAIQSVCDSINDKGIDGIFLDEDEEQIYIFQSKFSPLSGRDQGDVDIREFISTKEWFKDNSSLKSLLDSTASSELKSLIQGLNLTELEIKDFEIRLIFVTNKNFDTNAKEFLKLNEFFLEGEDFSKIFERYSFISDSETEKEPKKLLISNKTKIVYPLPNGIVANVFCIPIKELMKLDGIDDRTLFYKNVRYGLGNTRVNKEIRKTLQTQSEHNNFFLYHNGITILCSDLEESPQGELTIHDYSVINGCQSMLSFYENRNLLTENLFVLVKFIKLNQDSPLLNKITYYTNNQNSITLRDLKSNDRVHKQLQKEFNEKFNGKVLYKIKRGDSESGYEEIIETDLAAQLLEAVYLRSPHQSSAKYKLFGEDYYKIFSKNLNCSKIYLSKLIYDVIKSESSSLKPDKIGVYGLARFFFCYLISEIMREDELGKEIITNPENYLPIKREILYNSIKKLWLLLITDVVNFIQEWSESHENFFDYKNLFKNGDFVKEFERTLQTEHKRALIRHPEDSFKNIFTSLSETA